MTVAFLVGGAAVEQGKQVAMFLTKEAVRLGLDGYGEAVACDGCPPLSRLFSSTRTGAASCSSVRSASRRASSTTAALVGNARLAGATPALGVDRLGTSHRVQLLEAGGEHSDGLADPEAPLQARSSGSTPTFSSRLLAWADKPWNHIAIPARNYVRMDEASQTHLLRDGSRRFRPSFPSTTRSTGA